MPEDLIQVHQALYGYFEGHRLLAGSTRLDGEAQRALRSLTDVAFDGKAKSYLTICPIPTQRAHALIKTWPADPWTRPGSVWSHVLLVDLPDLGRIQGLQGIADAFCRPVPNGLALEKAELAAYQQPLSVPTNHFIKLVEPRPQFSLLSDLYHGLYDENDTVRIRVGDASDYEGLLLAVFEQQWPRLRRNFSCRTRQRATSVRMDLELVEQMQIKSSAGGESGAVRSAWSAFACEDLGNADPEYRQFLRMCGAESAAGRPDFRPLTELYEAVSRPDADPGRVVDLIASSFPAPEDQRGMKRMLFGQNSDEPSQSTWPANTQSGWPRTEVERISLAVKAARWLDLQQIDLGSRLVQSYRMDPGRLLLNDLDLETLTIQNIEALVGGITSRADIDTAVAVAISQPDLGLLIAAQNKQMLAAPSIWQHLDNDLLLDLLDDSTSPGLREFVLDRLLDQNAVEPIATICGVNPDDWWALLLRSSGRKDSLFFERAETLRASLVRLGTAALNSPPVRPQTPDELVTLLLAAELTSGLWRRATSVDWIKAAQQVLAQSKSGTPRVVRERLMAVALVSAIQSGTAEYRIDGWRVCYPYLHMALRDHPFDSEAWALLASTLPAGPAWDRCNRLRRGVAQEIKKDRWVADDVRAAVNASSPDSGALIALLEERAAKKKEHWLKQMLKMFT